MNISRLVFIVLLLAAGVVRERVSDWCEEQKMATLRASLWCALHQDCAHAP